MRLYCNSYTFKNLFNLPVTGLWRSDMHSLHAKYWYLFSSIWFDWKATPIQLGKDQADDVGTESRKSEVRLTERLSGYRIIQKLGYEGKEVMAPCKIVRYTGRHQQLENFWADEMTAIYLRAELSCCLHYNMFILYKHLQLHLNRLKRLSGELLARFSLFYLKAFTFPCVYVMCSAKRLNLRPPLHIKRYPGTLWSM